MGRFDKSILSRPVRRRPWKIHPIWRGIGCLFMVLLPMISFAAASLILEVNAQRGWVVLPDTFLRSFIVPYLGQVYVADVILTLLLMLIGFGLLTTLYSLFYRLFGPPRYGLLDAPPMPKRKRKRWLKK